MMAFFPLFALGNMFSSSSALLVSTVHVVGEGTCSSVRATLQSNTDKCSCIYDWLDMSFTSALCDQFRCQGRLPCKRCWSKVPGQAHLAKHHALAHPLASPWSATTCVYTHCHCKCNIRQHLTLSVSYTAYVSKCKSLLTMLS